jgi:putative sporulation protein YtaF
MEEELTVFQTASLLILAFAVSLDSFGVGMTYGMRKITIPLRSILIIAICSGLMILAAMLVGEGISYFLSPRIAEILGGFILLLIGFWAMFNMYRTRSTQSVVKQSKEVKVQAEAEEPSKFSETKYLWTLEIKKWGIVIQVLRKPMMADLDRSGVISGLEAYILGIALALDAFGAGIGAALMGYSPLMTALLIATMSSLFVYLGINCGTRFADAPWLRSISYLPAIILISFGLIKMF